MREIGSFKRIVLAYFEPNRSDFLLYHKAVDKYLRHLDVQNQPLLFKTIPDLIMKPAQIKKLFKQEVFPKSLYLRIITKQPEKHWVGNILLEFSKSEKKLCFGIHIFRMWRYRGFGPEAIKALLKTAHETYGVQYLAAGVHVTNKTSLKVFRKLGFAEFGRLKKSRFGLADKGTIYFELPLQHRA